MHVYYTGYYLKYKPDKLVTWTKKHTLCGYPDSLPDQIVFSAEKMNYFFL